MSNGLIISEKEFLCLPTKEQNLLLYKNQVKTMENQVKTMEVVKSYKFWYKMYTIIMGAVLIGVGILFKNVFGIVD